MRLFRRIEPAEGLSATVRELTVAEVRQLVADGGDLSPEALLRDYPGAVELAGEGWTPEAIAVVWEAFLDHNAAVFRERKASAGMPSERARALAGKRQALDFDRAFLRMAEAGHAQLATYPYRLFVLLCREAERRTK